MRNKIKIFIKSVSVLTILAILITFLPPVFQSRGATLTTIYDRLSTVEQSQTLGLPSEGSDNNSQGVASEIQSQDNQNRQSEEPTPSFLNQEISKPAPEE